MVQSVPMYSPTKIVTILKVSYPERFSDKTKKLNKGYGETNLGQMDTLSTQSVNFVMKIQFQNMLENKVLQKSTKHFISQSN